MNTNRLSPELQLALRYADRLSPEVRLQITSSPDPDIWELVIEHTGSLDDFPEEVISELVILNANFVTGFIRKEYIDPLSEIPDVIYIDLVSRMAYITSAALNDICALSVSTPEGSYNVTGEGTLLAVIDSGIDYLHTDFRKEDNTTRILYLWDQTLTGRIPSGFKKGAEFTEADINEALSMPTREETLARVPSVDILGHGTAITGIAAGNGRASRGMTRGVAPQAGLIIVKVGSPNPDVIGPRVTDIMQGIKYVIEKAQELNRPVSILLGTGTNKGAHNGKAVIEQYIDQMSQVWKNNITVGTGNQGNKDSHVEGRLAQGEEKQIQLAVTGNQLYYWVNIWKNFLDDIEIIIQSPRGEKTQVLNGRVRERAFVFGETQLFVGFSDPITNTNTQKILIFFEGPTDVGIEQGVWVITLRGENIVEGSYNIWGSIVEDTNTPIRFFGASSSTTLTIPSTSNNITSVACYNNVTSQIAAFSGRGYTSDLRVKPDLSAPGVGIAAPSSNPELVYEAVTGTSAAAAFTAGAYLLCMEYNFKLTGQWNLYGGQLKVYLLRNAKRLAINEPHPNPLWGYGILCIERALNDIRARGGRRGE